MFLKLIKAAIEGVVAIVAITAAFLLLSLIFMILA
jgi:hypothetical protein